MRKSGLGKGLDALFADNTSDEKEIRSVKLSEIEPNRNQPRKNFDGEVLEELADSIRRHGVIQPLVVRPLAGGSYQIVAGERRWRASQLLTLRLFPRTHAPSSGCLGSIALATPESPVSGTVSPIPACRTISGAPLRVQYQTGSIRVRNRSGIMMADGDSNRQIHENPPKSAEIRYTESVLCLAPKEGQ